ncbi:hypothetical protein [Vibrio splendidus]|uniref:Uncharacterized protein n=1 Tax=Vibrio splendidus TaxID=29497 RepID=A0A2T5EJN7_VIBSP|nr:hypothetical protein [Vibrio splendidus]EHY9845545.1 hypothetical protein [Vibrio cholerae]OEE57291.1 hypothetical protein A147_05135 [Vibrio splendidus FF-6]PTP20461.1 hypothetical protein CWO36_08010 [Vibrio splendidus]
MVVNTRKIVSLMMLSGWLLFAPAVLANGGAAAAAVAVMNSSNNSTRTEAILPQKSQIFDYRSNGEEPLETRIETFPPEKWRQLGGSQGGFFICPGKDSEYRTYLGNKRCRIPDIGVNGFLGGMKDHQELPLDEYLAITTGKSVDVQTVELTKNYLKVKFGLYPVGGAGQNPTSSVLINNGPEIAEAAKSGLEAGLPSLDEGVMTADEIRHELSQKSVEETVDLSEKTTEQQLPVLTFNYILEHVVEILDSTLVKGIAVFAMFAGFFQGVIRGSIIPLVVNLMFGIMVINASSLVEYLMIPLDANTDEKNSSFSLLPFVIVIAIYVSHKLIQMYRVRQEVERLSLFATSNAGRQTSRANRRDLNLPGLEELREQTQGQTEPVVLNQSTAAPKVQPVEPEIEITKNKRKIILD